MSGELSAIALSRVPVAIEPNAAGLASEATRLHAEIAERLRALLSQKRHVSPAFRALLRWVCGGLLWLRLERCNASLQLFDALRHLRERLPDRDFVEDFQNVGH